MAIQLRRGDYTDFDPSQLLDGELAVVLENDPNTDDGTGTYVSYGDSNVKRLLTEDDDVEVPIASSETAGIVKPDGTTITVDEDGTLRASGAPRATTETAGIVRPDGTSIIVDGDGDGVISASEATYDSPGIVQPDNTTIIVSDYGGYIHVPTATNGALGLVQVDGTSVIIDSDGVISVGLDPFDYDPAMDGTASAGNADTYARGDHVHPTDTSRASAVDLMTHADNGNIHVTEAQKSAWNAKADATPATSSSIGLVKPDNTTINVANDGTISGVMLDSDSFTEFNGVTSLNPATDSTLGGVKVDSDNGTVRMDSNDTLYVPAADASTPGVVQPDDETTYIDHNGLLSVMPGLVPADYPYDPEMDGTASAGSSDAYARGDHVHPTDTSRASASDLTSHVGDSTAHVTAAERTTWNAKASTATATTSTNGLMSASDKSKLDGIADNANAYELPAATTSTLGGVKADGMTILVDADGTIHGAGELSVSVTADGNSVSGATIVVREGSASGAVVATYPYSGTPVTIRLPMGYHYCVTASDDLRMYGPPVPVTGVVGVLTQSITVTYSALESVLEKVDGVYTNESISEYLRRTRTGDVYGVSEPLTAAVALTKTDANADLAAPTPGYIGTPAIDPYDNLGPFLFRVCNGSVDADGVPHVTAIEGIDSDFERDGSNGNVWQMHGIIYESWETTETANLHKITDTPREGYQPHDQCTLPDGTMRPYMVTAAYPLGKNPFDNDSPASISGVAPRTRDVSHNSGITICSTASTGYSLKSTYDDWYIKTMFEMKYATKHSQSVYAGCTSYNLQYNPAVAETGVKRVIVTNAQAANFVIGSNCQFGTRTGASDNDRNRAQNYDIFDKVTITSIEAYDANNSAINFDAPNTFDSATTCLLSTAPWNCGCLDAVVGDGTLSVAGRTNGKEPFKIQGIELAHGMYEVLGNVIISNDGSTGWTPYVCADTRNAATSVTANYTACDHVLPTNDADGWKYPAHTVYSNGLRYGADMSASSSTGLNDGTYTNKLATTGMREWPGLGYLNGGSHAGLWCVGGTGGLSGVNWSIGSRLSGTGRAAA